MTSGVDPANSDRMADDLQFEKAELPQQAGGACSSCGTALQGEYFQANGKVFCARCAEQLRQFNVGPGTRGSRFLRAALMGAGVAAVGAAAYYAINKATGMEIALITIAIGHFVGKFVRKGSGNRGGWRYQILAAVLTYLSVVAIYVPDIAAGVHKQVDERRAEAAEVADRAGTRPEKSPLPKPVQIVIFYAIVLVIAAVAPVLAGFKNVLGILIIGFGVWEAWRLNKRFVLEVTGPHSLGAGPPATAGV
jgi:hypothetical protein